MRKAALLSGVVLILMLLLASLAPAAFAQTVTGDKVVWGDNYTLQAGQTLEGNLTVMGGNATIEADALVSGDVLVMGGTFTLDGTVTGNVTTLGGTARLGSTAVVEGNLSTVGGSVSQAPGAVVQGDSGSALTMPQRIVPAPVLPQFPPQAETPRSWFGRFVGWQFGTLGSILLMGLLGLVLVLVAPRAVGRVSSAVAVQPALSFVFGLLTLLVGALAGAILLIACGLGLLVWLALAAASVLGWIGVALWLGQRLLRALNMRSASAIAEVLVGVVIITFLSRLPCIGWLFWLVFASWGLGAVVLTRFGTRDADAPSARPALAPSSPTGGTGGSGGGFAPLPETSEFDLAAAPVAPPAEPVAPVVPAAIAAGALAADEPGVAPVDASLAPVLTDIAGIDAEIAARLEMAGIRTVSELAASHPVELSAATGVTVGQIMTEDWIGQAQRLA